MQRHLILPNTSVDLSTVETRGGNLLSVDKEVIQPQFAALRRELSQWQHILYAQHQHKILIVLQALDAGGKDGTIRNVFKGANAQGVTVTPFKSPTKEELAHDYLWRIHKCVPAKGMIGIFNRSHYEDVLVARVQSLVPESVWRPRYEQINQFENYLTDTGTTILKFYLHISKDEQKARLQERLDHPDKWWKFDPNDLKQRAKWDEYQAAFEDMFLYCSTEVAPWHVIPSDQKWYRDYAIAKAIVYKLRSLELDYPDAQDDMSQYKIK